MPSHSENQAKFMSASCHNKEFAKKVGIDQDVACEFNKADQKVKEDVVTDPVDTITMDVPLFIRMLEFAKEDAKTDMDLHSVTEKAIELSKDHSLTMADYDSIVPKDEIPQEEPNKEDVGIFKESIMRLSKYGI